MTERVIILAANRACFELANMALQRVISGADYAVSHRQLRQIERLIADAHDALDEAIIEAMAEDEN